MKRSQGLIAIMAADLSLGGKDPGCRPPGRVDNPQVLRMKVSAEYA